jgi:hypothetical protein
MKKVAIVGDSNYKHTIKTFLTAEDAYGNGLLCSDENRIYYIDDDKYLTCRMLDDVNNYREFIIIRPPELIKYIAEGYTLSSLTQHLNKKDMESKLNHERKEVANIEPIDSDVLNFNNEESSNIEIETFKSITKEMSELYAKKNADYGNSFDKGMDTIGMAYGVGRMYDKMNRIINLTKGHEAKVKDEKLEDTVLDLANYSVMLLSYLKRNGKKL